MTGESGGGGGRGPGGDGVLFDPDNAFMLKIFNNNHAPHYNETLAGNSDNSLKANETKENATAYCLTGSCCVRQALMFPLLAS